MSMQEIEISPSPRSQRHREVKDSLKASAHPVWVQDMLVSLRPAWDAVVGNTLIEHTTTSAFPERSWRRAIKEFFCVIEAFPKYMGLSLAKTTFGRSPRDVLARDWLIGNIRIEAMHARWYLDWASAHDIHMEEVVSYRPCPEVAALCEWLWSISHRGSLSEAIGAVNFAIEGVTGEWTKRVLPAFMSVYDTRHTPKAHMWLSAHAKYDDAHPLEALEIVKLSTTTAQEIQRVESATLRSLELFSRAFEACCEDDCRVVAGG